MCELQFTKLALLGLENLQWSCMTLPQRALQRAPFLLHPFLFVQYYSLNLSSSKALYFWCLWNLASIIPY